MFLIESLGGGGAEKVLSTLVEHIDKERFDVTVCPITDVGAYSAQIKKFVNVKAILPPFPATGSPLAKLMWRVKHRLVHKLLPLSVVYRLWVPKGNDVEVAFVEGLTTKLLSKASSRSRKIAWVHIDLCNNHWTAPLYGSNEAEADAYHVFDKVVGVSKVVTESVNRLFGAELPTLTLYNPIDVDDILDKAAMVEQSVPPRRAGVVRLCSAGRLVPQKGFDRLLRIVKRLTDEGYRLELWLLGDGELRPEFETYVAANNLGDVVTLWGFKSNPYAYMAQCDLFVCSSVAEGYSTAVTEALILGLPVITTLCSGMDELLGANGEYGVITENSENALYDGLIALLDSQDSIAELAAKAKKRSGDFSIEKLVKPIEEFLGR